MSGQGGSSHSLALHTSLEKEREEEGERDEDQTVGEERCQVSLGGSRLYILLSER